MNIANFHESVKANDILELSPIFKKSFENYDDAKFKRLSIFFYNQNALASIEIPEYHYTNKSATSYLASDELINYNSSYFQVFFGKIDGYFIFVDFGNEFEIMVEEKYVDDYVSNLFRNEDRHSIIENDFKPIKEKIISDFSENRMDVIRFKK